ncbi:hypothetical protein JTB14_001812 [Gonioctena quinquepunctata]|nr:hypothetical protein JTB14_001812 [Gonioctena quinquepunctata]
MVRILTSNAITPNTYDLNQIDNLKESNLSGDTIIEKGPHIGDKITDKNTHTNKPGERYSEHAHRRTTAVKNKIIVGTGDIGKGIPENNRHEEENCITTSIMD